MFLNLQRTNANLLRERVTIYIMCLVFRLTLRWNKILGWSLLTFSKLIIILVVFIEKDKKPIIKYSRFRIQPVFQSRLKFTFNSEILQVKLHSLFDCLNTNNKLGFKRKGNAKRSRKTTLDKTSTSSCLTHIIYI